MPRKRKQTENTHQDPSGVERRPLTPPLAPPSKKRTRTRHPSTQNPSTPTTHPHPHPQAQSPFFHLPREIRDIIYNEIFVFNQTIHIAYVGGRNRTFRSFLCKLPERDQFERTRSGTLCWRCRTVSDHYECSPKDPRNHLNVRGAPTLAEKREFRVMALLRACRRLYIETIDLLYIRNRFYIKNPRTLLELPAYTPQPRLSSIRTLYLESPPHTAAVSQEDPILKWKKVLKALEKLDGLTDLCVILQPVYGFASDIEALERPVRETKLVVQPRVIVKKLVRMAPANPTPENGVCRPNCAVNPGVSLGLLGAGTGDNR
ncbi:hypothetical protein BJX66DRAFT_335053 [Aspergillus keveii]|uniref:DUF7730 domain-containing protein n=1 Tax=Aspergillus keveii TaxID=714993 RepID=A0ABR4GEF8_9EURO